MQLFNASQILTAVQLEKSNLFAEHLASVFTPNSDNSNDNDLEAYLNAPCQLSLPARAFTPNEINKANQLLSRRKAPDRCHDSK
jgi:hypothetical protein